MKIVRRSDSAALARALDRAAATQPSWHGDPTLGEHRGFHVDTYRRRLGNGADVFNTAVETVMTWGVQRGAGLVVHSRDDRVRVGIHVIVGLPIGPALVLAPCRVIDVFDGDRGGFRYVTLPGHPEQGFEEFIVERSAGGDVTFVVRPVSRPASAVTRLAGPVARVIQRRAAHRYLDAVAKTA